MKNVPPRSGKFTRNRSHPQTINNRFNNKIIHAAVGVENSLKNSITYSSNGHLTVRTIYNTVKNDTNPHHNICRNIGNTSCVFVFAVGYVTSLENFEWKLHTY